MGNTALLAAESQRTGSDPTHPKFDWDLAGRLVGAMVIDSPQIQTLIKSLVLEDADVIDAGVVYAAEQWPDYEPVHKGVKIAPQTFIQQRANSGVYNFLRKSGSQFRTEQRSMNLLPRRDAGRELCDWLKDVFEAAKRVYVDRKLNARRTYPVPIVVAIGSLMNRDGLSCRDCARLLSKRDDLRTVLRMQDRVPHWTTLARAKIFADKITGFRATESTGKAGSDATGEAGVRPPDATAHAEILTAA